MAAGALVFPYMRHKKRLEVISSSLSRAADVHRDAAPRAGRVKLHQTDFREATKAAASAANGCFDFQENA